MEEFYPFVFETPVTNNVEYQYLYIDEYQPETNLIEELIPTAIIIDIF